MRVRSRLLLASLATASLLPAGRAGAAGFYVTDVGTRGMARAGAFVAAPDSLLAAHYNPAGLSLLKGLHAEGSLNLVSADIGFRRGCPCVDGADPEAAAKDAALVERYADTPARSNNVLSIPFLGVGYGFDFMDLTVALAAWGPTSGRHDYGELPGATSPRFPTLADEQPGRYSGLRMKTIEANFSLGLGFRPLPDALPGLRLGFSLIGFQNGNRQTVHLWANSGLLGPESPEDPNLDVPIVFDFLEPFALNWQAGASYELIPGLTLGSSFRARRDVTADGTISIDLPTKLAEGDQPLVEVQGQDIAISFATAAIFRVGLQYAMPDVFRAEVAAVYEGWSAHDQVVIQPRDISLSVLGMASSLGQIVANRRWRDTWSLRVGGQLDLLKPELGLTGGYFYEPAAIPDTNLDPSRTDFDKHGFALGVSTQLAGFTLEVSGMAIASATREVTTSTQRQIAPLPGGQDLVTTIANGTYSATYFIGSASLAYALDL